MQSGNLDITYLAKILDFALSTLRKLSSPASDAEMKVKHTQILKELAEICEAGGLSKQAHAIAMVKGLRFVFEQIQVFFLDSDLLINSETPFLHKKIYNNLQLQYCLNRNLSRR